MRNWTVGIYRDQNFLTRSYWVVFQVKYCLIIENIKTLANKITTWTNIFQKMKGNHLRFSFRSEDLFTHIALFWSLEIVSRKCSSIIVSLFSDHVCCNWWPLIYASFQEYIQLSKLTARALKLGFIIKALLPSWQCNENISRLFSKGEINLLHIFSAVDILLPPENFPNAKEFFWLQATWLCFNRRSLKSI